MLSLWNRMPLIFKIVLPLFAMGMGIKLLVVFVLNVEQFWLMLFVGEIFCITSLIMMLAWLVGYVFLGLIRQLGEKRG